MQPLVSPVVLAGNEYLGRHNQVAKILHQKIALKYKLIDNELPYYQYKPLSALENSAAKLYWDRPILTDRTIPANRPDIVLVDHSKNTTYIVDVTIPHDENLQKAERDKILKYMDLAHDIKDMWQTPATIVVPIVISTNGLIPKSLHANPCKAGVDGGLKYLMQKAVRLSTCRTLHHEARSHHYDDDDIQQAPNEYTPLLRSYAEARGARFTTILVAILIFFMIFGVIISIFLFIEQDKKWPINIPFEMVQRTDWGAKSSLYPYKNITNIPVNDIIITHTNTPMCLSMDSCEETVRKMQTYYQNITTVNRTDLPFNFFITPFGITFEGRGWHYCGEVDPSHDCTSLSVAAIGNFSNTLPPLLVIKEFKAFLDEAIWRSKLSPNYVIVGRPFGTSPDGLFHMLRNWKHWSGVESYRIVDLLYKN